MSEVGPFDAIKSFDLYKRLPKDLVQPTVSGALCKVLINNIISITNKLGIFDISSHY